MVTNVASSFSGDIEQYIADETLPLARKFLVAYRFGDPLTLPEGRGTTYTATRYNRVPLPFQPLSEGVPPIGEQMTISQVNVTAQQWGDKITLTDVAELTVKHPLVKEAEKLIALQISETLDRNTFNTLMSGTQINYINSRGARSALQSTDVMNTVEIGRAYSQLYNIGAPRFMGDEQTDVEVMAESKANSNTMNADHNEHYVAMMHPFVAEDMRNNTTVVTAWSYSDIRRLYNNEFGAWNGIRVVTSNMIPFWTYQAAPTGTGGTAGSLATNTYYIKITGSDTQNNYESIISAASAGVAVTGPNGSISVTTPSTAGYTWNIYISTSNTTFTTLALSSSGPSVGPLAGQAVQLPGSTSVVLTGIGASQTPPALPPSAGYTVYPTFIIARGAYGQVKLKDIQISLLTGADKSDPLNQLRVVGWKVFYGTIILNQTFFMRIESVSAYGPTFG